MEAYAPCLCLRGGDPGSCSPWLFTAILLPLSALQTRTFNASAGSVLLPHLLHQSIHAAAEALPWRPRVAAPFAISVLIACVLAVFAVIAWPSMWTRR